MNTLIFTVVLCAAVAGISFSVYTFLDTRKRLKKKNKKT